MAAFGWSKTRLAAAAGLATVIGATAVGAVYAQTPTATPTRQQKAEDHLNRFAQNLGVDVAKVKEAMKTTALQHIDEQVAAGRLTAEQAQKMKDAIASGQMGQFGGFGGPGKGGFGGHKGGPGGEMRRGPGGPGGMLGVAHDALATFLGVTPEALKTELNGKSLAAVATAHGKSADDLKAFITSNAQTRANEAVTAGRLTQAQATTMLDALKANLDTMINAVHQPGGPGMHKRGPGGPLAPKPPVATTTPGTSF